MDWNNLSRAEQVALSNTICGEPSAVRGLEAKGLVTNVEDRAEEYPGVLFYGLTDEGERLVQENCVIRTRAEADDRPWADLTQDEKDARARRAAERVRALRDRERGWVACEEELPNDGHRVAFVLKGRGPQRFRIGEYDGEHFRKHDGVGTWDGRYAPIAEVTHWCDPSYLLPRVTRPA